MIMSWALVYIRNSLLGALDCGRQLLHYPVSHLFHFDGAFPDKIGLADSSGKNTFVIYDFAVYDRGIDVLLGRGIDDSRFRVVIWEGGSNRIISAFFPTSSVPIRFSIPIAFAPEQVAIRIT